MCFNNSYIDTIVTVGECFINMASDPIQQLPTVVPGSSLIGPYFLWLFNYINLNHNFRLSFITGTEKYIQSTPNGIYIYNIYNFPN